MLALNVKNAIGVRVTPIARGIRAADETVGSPPGSALPNVAVMDDDPLIVVGNVAVPEMPPAIAENVALTGAAPALTI